MSVVNAIFGLAFLALIAGVGGPSLATFAVFGGYWANAAALLVTAILLVLLAVQSFRGHVAAFFRKNWLGFFNGAFIVALWLLLSWFDSKHMFAS